MLLDNLLRATRAYLESRSEPEVCSCFGSFDWRLPLRELTPHTVPGCQHLPRLIEASGTGEIELVTSFLEHQPDLHWGRSYTAADFGQYFFDNYGFVELIGQRGHFASDQLAIGFVMFGPELDYPPHWHVAEEFYFPLTNGALWSRDGEDFAPRDSGDFVFHPSNMHHAMTTKKQALLALYVWRSPPGLKADLAQKSNF